MNMTREEAIGRIQEHIHIHSKKEPFTPYLDKAFDMAIEALKEQRPHGEWEKKSICYDYFYCSECGYAYKHAFNFCPNCGADMREGEVNDFYKF